MEFRKLNSTEREAFASLDFKGKINDKLHGPDALRVQYINQQDDPGNRRNLKSLGSFTICCVIDPLNTSLKWVGVSRRSSKDKPNRVRGNMLAFIRAITSSPVQR